MKRTILHIGLGLMAMSCLVSCGGEKKDADNNQKVQALAKKAADGTLPNYRFVDIDTLMLKYNLSVDFNEQMIRMQNNYQEEEKRQNNSLNSKGESFQKRYQAASQQSVPLPSEMDALQKEYESLQSQANQAQQKLAKLGMEIEQSQVNNFKTVMDSIQNFLKEYAAAHGYDAIIASGTGTGTLYYDPALDVTEEVVEGLNARYNKVK